MQDETESAWYPGITEKHFEHAIQDAVRKEREAGARTPGCGLSMTKIPTKDGFYYYQDPLRPSEFGIMYRENGVSWRIGASRPLLDDQWVDGVLFSPVPAPPGV